jgi:hypothetical protein
MVAVKVVDGISEYLDRHNIANASELVGALHL